MEGQIQIRSFLFLRHLQGVEIGVQVAARAKCGDQLQHAALLACGFVVDGSSAGVRARSSCGLLEVANDRRVGDIAVLAPAQLVEVRLPSTAHTAGRNQILLVQIFNKGRIAPRYVRGLAEFGDQIGVWVGIWIGFGTGHGSPCPRPDERAGSWLGCLLIG